MTNKPNSDAAGVLAVIDMLALHLPDRACCNRPNAGRPGDEAECCGDPDNPQEDMASVRTAVQEIIAERDAKDACLIMIYSELQHHAPWSESNDMDPADEMICGLGLLVQDRDALRAELDALRAAVNELKFDINELALQELRDAFDGAKTICVVQMDSVKALREAMALATTPTQDKAND